MFQSGGPSGATVSPQFIPPQFFPTSFRNFPRGRGRGPRMPCDICGRSNHTTNYCYYKSSFPQMIQSNASFPPMFQQIPQPMFQTFPQQQNFQQMPQQYIQSSQWRSLAPSLSWMHGSNPWMNASPYPSSVPMFQSPSPAHSGASMVPSQSAFQSPNPSTSQAHFAGFTDGSFSSAVYPPPGLVSGGSQYGVTSPAGFHGGYSSASSSVTSPATQPWYFDSGATNHITNNLQNLTNPQPVTLNDGIMVGNGSHLQVSHTGKGLLPTPITNFRLSHVLHTPNITHNLISVFQFANDNHCTLMFDSSGLEIQDKITHKLLYKGPCHKGLYPILTSSKHTSGIPISTAFVNSSSSEMLWHQKLGHPSLPLFVSLIKQHGIPVSKPQLLNCKCCNMAKSHKLQFSKSETVSTSPFQLVHMDV